MSDQIRRVEKRYFLEWAFWMALAGFVYSMTGDFSGPLPEYQFGADGWPKAICIALAIGATGQLLYQISPTHYREAVEASDEAVVARPTRRVVLQLIGIFSLPLIYLYFMPRIGFLIATPIFIFGLLALLEVKRITTMLAVTGVIYGLFILVFIRLFYVAVPVGRWPGFYDVNNAIIVFARTGL